jgi:DNA-binding response OmpR family regulator
MRPNKEIKLLIADNDEGVLIELERVFEDEGYATTTVLTREEVSSLLCNGEYDLVVLDDFFSDGDSVDVLTNIQRSGMRPLIVVTFNRYPAPDQRARLRELGVSAFVDKLAHPEIVDIVRHLLAPRPGVRARGDDFDSIT